MLRRLVALSVFCSLTTASLLALNPQGSPANGPKAEITRKDSSSKGQLQSGAQHENTGTPKTPSVVVQVEAPTVDDHSADRQEEKEIQRKLADYTLWLVVFTAVLALVGLGQGYFLRQQARHLQEHAGHLHALAGAATDNAKAAQLTAQAVIDSERGWLQVTLGTIQLPTSIAPESLMVFFLFPTVTNKGKTVCRLTEMFLTKRFVKSRLDLPSSPVYEVKGCADSESSVLRDELILAPDFPLTPLGIGISMAEVLKVRDAVETLYVYGYVRYEISGLVSETTRLTRFCFHYHIPGGFTPLPEGFLMPTGLPEYTRAT